MDNLHFITKIKQTYPTPKGNAILYREDRDGKNEELDPFNHELILAITTHSGLCLFTGCAHNGVLNIVDTVQTVIPDKEIICVYGGFHLIADKGYVQVESEEELINVATQLTNLLPNAHFYTGHCTSDRAIEVLRDKMQGRLTTFCVGKNTKF